ncbi:mucin-2-like isoform X1 [Salvelinus fontinalis]|uniref:mucin-2-like isoform X1 n=2 Tax=Salvelinus fontinalis TaxID=8038 RepID=UPI002484FC98|nr:mucin-2-like isoform X1 [Salvelinus fontinalis]
MGIGCFTIGIFLWLPSEGSKCVHFEAMSLGFSEVHRPSTVSSVTEPICVLTTEWAWFWEDEYGKWVQYASIKEMHRLSSITSEDLEKRFQEDQSAVVKFTAGQQSYELSFRDMTQKNKRYGTVRMVRRRPVLVSTADSRTNRTCNSSQNFRDVPGFWDKSAIPDIGYKTVTLLSSDRDYQKVQRLFNNTMRGFQITSIERVQNRDLWEVFQWKRDLMKKNSGGKNSKELHLFHGTDPKNVDAICRDNFDWRLCGTNGTVYGEGSYFARDAKYSHCFISHSGVRSMFVCRVLVGDYTQGNSDLRRPPPKGEGSPTLYDSCVDNVLNPSIYVVFEKHQVYPEFLIKYDDGVMHLSSSAPAPPKTVSIQSTYIVQYPTSNRIQAAAAAATLSNSRVPSTSTLNPSQAATTFSNPTNSLPPSRLPKPAQTSLGFSQSAVIMKLAPSSQLVDTTLGQANWSYTPSFSKLPHKLITQASTTSRTPTTPPSTPSYTPTTPSYTLPTPASTPSYTRITPASTLSYTRVTPASTPPPKRITPASIPSRTRITPASTPSRTRITPASTPTTPASTPSRTPTTPASTLSYTRITPASTPSRTPTSPASTPSRTPTTPASTPSRTPTTPASTPSRTLTPSVSAPSRTLITPGTAHTRTLIRSSNPFRTLTTPASPPSRTLSRSTDTPSQAHTSSTTTTHSLPASSTSHSLSPSYSLSTPYHTPSHSSYTPTSTDSSTLLGSHHSTSTTTSDTSATITSSRVQDLIKQFGGQSSTC